LAVAYRDYPQSKEVFSSADEKDLILLGYIAFFDPPKESSAVALRALHKSGVKIKILTGDNQLVTQKVCREVGLTIEGLATGNQLVDLNEEELGNLAEKTTVFAR